MARVFDDMPVRAALTAIAHDFHARGWMAGTAGNLSARAGEESFWITASGQPKGRLDESDFLRVRTRDGEILERFDERAKPSAETAIHRVIYQRWPQARACLHVHTVDACLATGRAARGDALLLPPIEMIKGLGIWEEAPRVSLPVFDNPLDVAAIARAIEARFSAAPPDVPALMIRSHGVTVWGDSLQEAYNRVEIVEFLMSYLARQG